MVHFFLSKITKGVTKCFGRSSRCSLKGVGETGRIDAAINLF